MMKFIESFGKTSFEEIFAFLNDESKVLFSEIILSHYKHQNHLNIKDKENYLLAAKELIKSSEPFKQLEQFAASLNSVSKQEELIALVKLFDQKGGDLT